VVVDEVLRQIGRDGSILLVQTLNDTSAQEEFWKFEEHLKEKMKRSDLKGTVFVEQVPAFYSDLSNLSTNAPLPEAARYDAPYLPYSVFEVLLEKYPGVTLVLSMIGPPDVTQSNADNWSRRKTRLGVVMLSGDPQTAQTARAYRALDFGVFPRLHGKSLTGKLPKTPRAWFDSQFQLVTPDTLGQMK
jgi:hypothetical protein